MSQLLEFYEILISYAIRYVSAVTLAFLCQDVKTRVTIRIFIFTLGKILKTSLDTFRHVKTNLSEGILTLQSHKNYNVENANSVVSEKAAHYECASKQTYLKAYLPLKVPETKLAEFANRVVPNEAALQECAPISSSASCFALKLLNFHYIEHR